MPSAGKYRHLVTIQQPATPSQDANGEPTPAWQTLGKVWGRISPKDGRQLALSQIPTTTATVTHEIEIRFLAGVTAGCRILYGTRVFTVNASRNEDERNIRQFILATEVVA
jgi:SPP1 family predicted phage head-tail adaptor